MKGRASKWLCKGPVLVLLLLGGVRAEVGQQMAAGGCERVRRLEAECVLPAEYLGSKFKAWMWGQRLCSTRDGAG